MSKTKSEAAKYKEFLVGVSMFGKYAAVPLLIVQIKTAALRTESKMYSRTYIRWVYLVLDCFLFDFFTAHKLPVFFCGSINASSRRFRCVHLSSV